MNTCVAAIPVFLLTVVATANAQTPDPKKVEAGQQVYATQKCATCHAVKGTGGKLAAALDDVGKKLTEADLKKWLTAPAEMEAKLPNKPKSSMAGFLKSRKLSDTDVDALVAYMSTLK